MIYQDFGELPDEIGYIVSPIVKLIVMGALGIVLVAMAKKARIKKQIIPRNLTIMFAIYFLAPLFSSFDILLGWEYFNSAPPDKTYLGMSLAFVCHGLGNIIYYWFLLEIYYEKEWAHKKRIRAIILIILTEILSTTLALFLRLNLNSSAFIFTIIHMIITMYIFVMILTNSIRAEAKIDDPIFKNRFKNISRASFFGLIMIVLFAIDSLFAGVTIYSLTGWVSLIFTCYFLYKGYI